MVKNVRHFFYYIFTHILQRYSIDYNMGTAEMCRRYLKMNRNQANIQFKIFHSTNFMRAMSSVIVPFFSKTELVPVSPGPPGNDVSENTLFEVIIVVKL